MIDGGLDCLMDPANESAQFAVDGCIDCTILLTYVKTPESELYRVSYESDTFGDRRTASVERCEDFSRKEYSLVQCTNPTKLYSCRENL